jgi:hypothetical protein
MFVGIGFVERVPFHFRFALILEWLLNPVVIFSAKELTFSISLTSIPKTFFQRPVILILLISRFTLVSQFKFVFTIVTSFSHDCRFAFPISFDFMFRSLLLV